MPQVFYDDFERPDGAPGPLWVNVAGSPYISGGKLIVPNGAVARPNVYLNTLDQEISARLVAPTADNAFQYFTLRTDATSLTWVGSFIGITASQIRVGFYQRVAGSYTALLDYTTTYAVPSGVQVRYRAVGTKLTLELDGETVATYIYSGPANGPYAGLYANNVAISALDCRVMEVTAPSFSVVPSTIDQETGIQLLTLTSDVGNWTEGTPGVPIFYSSTGTIVSQTIDSPGTAIIQYRPPEFDIQDVILDPQENRRVVLDLSTRFDSAGGTGGTGEPGTLTQDLIDALTVFFQTDPGTPVSRFFDLMEIIAGRGTSNGTDLAEVIRQLTVDDTDPATLRHQVNGTYGLAFDSHVNINTLTGNGAYTLAGMLSQLRGDWSLSHTDLSQQIAALSSPDLSKLDTIINILWEVRTNNAWSLGSVKTWIDALEVGDNQDVLDELDIIRGDADLTLTNLLDAITMRPTNPITSLQPAIDEIRAVRGSGQPDLAAVLAAISGVTSNGGSNLWDLLRSIATVLLDPSGKLESIATIVKALSDILGETNISASFSNVQRRLPPIWPGIANVTVGETVPMIGGMNLVGPFDGVTIEITNVPQAKRYYSFGPSRSYKGAGALAFYNDQGAKETYQLFGWDKGMYTPKSMTYASGLVLYCGAGVWGTITPWLVNGAS